MADIILSVNSGSSSVKISVYKAPPGSKSDPIQLAEATVEGLTAPPAKLKYSRGDKKIKGEEVQGIKSQEDAFRFILDHLTKDDGLPELGKKEDVKFTCHRVVHGGEYPRSQVIDKETFHHLEELSDLAPLHNTPALQIIRTSTNLLPSSKNIAYFDTSFHSTIPPYIYTYPISPTTASHNKLRKYGFHGLSYAFILTAVSTFLCKPVHSLNIIALHLGSGASACCIHNGTSLDTSMGLTPLSGLPGATRSGDIDPSLIFHFTHTAGKPSHTASKNLHITMAEEILNKESGWKSLTGTTDFGVISRGAFEFAHDDNKGEEESNKNKKLAFDIFVDRVTNHIAAYHTKLDGAVDALVFAGGIGERGCKFREVVGGKIGCLGFGIDTGKNQEVEGVEGVVVDIGVDREGEGKRVLVVRTDEQLQMARGVVEDRERFGEGREVSG